MLCGVELHHGCNLRSDLAPACRVRTAMGRAEEHDYFGELSKFLELEVEVCFGFPKRLGRSAR